MAGPTLNQQTNPGTPAEIRLVRIQRRMTAVIFCQSSLQPHAPITKYNLLSPVHSMIPRVVEFFVPAVPALVNAPKRDQVLAAFGAEIAPFHLVTG